MESKSEVARYRTGMADLLAKLVAVTGEIERRLRVAEDGDETSTRAVLEDDPTAIFRIMCTLLLRKAKLHAVAVLRANETGNVHSLAVQMRPVLECAGQIVLIFHNLMIAPESGESVVRGYMNADYYRTTIALTKGETGHKQLLREISAASGMTQKQVRRGRKLSHIDKLMTLEGGEDWYRYLSECFCHGEADWNGHSWQGGVSSMNTVRGRVYARWPDGFLGESGGGHERVRGAMSRSGGGGAEEGRRHAEASTPSARRVQGASGRGGVAGSKSRCRGVKLNGRRRHK